MGKGGERTGEAAALHSSRSGGRERYIDFARLRGTEEGPFLVQGVQGHFSGRLLTDSHPDETDRLQEKERKATYHYTNPLTDHGFLLS